MKTKRTSLIRLSKKGSKRQRGASLIEYGLLVALIAVIGMPAVKIVGQSIYENFNRSAQDISAAAADVCHPPLLC